MKIHNKTLYRVERGMGINLYYYVDAIGRCWAATSEDGDKCVEWWHMVGLSPNNQGYPFYVERQNNMKNLKPHLWRFISPLGQKRKVEKATGQVTLSFKAKMPWNWYAVRRTR